MSCLVHIVAWKYKSSTDAESKEEHRSRLKALKDKIPELIELHVGEDVLKLERSFDTGLVAKFKDREGLDVYTDHPDHLEAASFGKTVAKQVISVDFFSDQ